MINPKNKRIELTLSNEEVELLNSICLRFNITKSRAISQALKVFAAKRKHQITVIYREPDIHQKQEAPGEKNESSEEISDEEYQKYLEELENHRK